MTPGGGLNITLGQFELHPPSREVNSEALLVPRVWNEKGQPSLSPPQHNSFQCKVSAAQVKMPADCTAVLARAAAPA